MNEKRNVKHFCFANALVTCAVMGYLPRGSGTLASFVSLPFWIGLGWAFPHRGVQILVTLVFMFAGVWAIRVYEAATQTEDSSRIVIDEWVGMGISLWALPLPTTFLGASFGGLYVIAAFFLFRLFDIWKPMGVRYFDRNHLHGWGVMLDDVVAGIYAATILMIFRWWFER